MTRVVSVVRCSKSGPGQITGQITVTQACPMSQHQHLIALGAASACCCAAAWYCWHTKPELLKKAQRLVSRNAPLWRVQVLLLSNRCILPRGVHVMTSVAFHHTAFHKPPTSTNVCVNTPQHTSLAYIEPCWIPARCLGMA